MNHASNTSNLLFYIQFTNRITNRVFYEHTTFTLDGHNNGKEIGHFLTDSLYYTKLAYSRDECN